MSKRRKKSPAEDRHESATETTSAARKPRRWRRILILGSSMMVVLLVLAVLAPTIATRTFLRDYVVAKLLPPEVGFVSLTSLRAGWLTSFRVQDLKIFDPQGKPLLEVEQLEVDRSILGLVISPSDWGNLVVSKPVLHLLLRPDGCNLEDALAQLQSTAAGSESEALGGFAARMEFIDATILAAVQDSDEQWRIHDLSVCATMPKSTSEDWTATAAGQLDGQTFAVEIAAPLGAASERWPLGRNGHLQLQSDQLPLKPIQYVSNRTGMRIEQLAGTLSASISASWMGVEETMPPAIEINGFVLAKELVLVAPTLLGPDSLRLDHLKFETQARFADGLLALTQCDLDSDFGEVKLQSTGKWSGFAPRQLSELAREAQLASSGRVDIAAIARSFPRVLKVRDDIQLASGQVSWSLKTEAALAETTKWTGTLSTSNVQVLKSDAPIDWRFPLELTFAAKVGAELELERLTAKSDSFAFVAAGRLQSGSINGQADLERLVSQLSEILDLDGVSLRGQLQANVKWDEAGPNMVSLDGHSTLKNFVMARHEQVLCSEAELTASTKATAMLDGNHIASINSVRMDARSGGDSFICQLREVVAPDAVEDWPIDCWMRGELASWIARLEPFGISLDWDVHGTAQITASALISQRGTKVQSLVADVRDLTAITNGIRINEPVVQVKAAGTIDHGRMSCHVPSATVTSQSLSFAAEDLRLGLEPHFAASGRFGYRADVGRLMSYVPAQSTTELSGNAIGQLQLQSQQQMTSFRVSSRFEDLRVVREGRPIWNEPQATIHCEGNYHAIEDRLDVAQAEVSGKFLSLATAGSATHLSKDPVCEFSGNYTYDLTGLVAIFAEVLGPEVRLTGKQQQRFSLNGPIFPNATSKHRISPQLAAQAGCGWDSAIIYGVPLDQAQLDMSLANGVLQMTPLSLTVAGGRVQVAPAVYLNSELLWTTIKPGLVAEQVRITPAMSNSWMKYVTPLLAEATDAEGSFSVFLDRTEVPLMSPATGEIDGRLAIHGAAVRPGPLAMQCIEMATQIKRLAGRGDSRITDPTKTWIELGEQVVTFQLAHGRVYHEGFQMLVDGVPIATRGSVGVVDETISVMAEVPILDEWISDSPALAGLRGQVITIPISGTLSRPSVDRRALSKLANQLVQQAAQGYIQKEVGSQLQKRLGGKLEGLLGDGQDGTGNALQEEIGKQLNRLFK